MTTVCATRSAMVGMPRGACRRCPSVSRRAARVADGANPTTSDSRPCTGCPSGPSRTPPRTRRPRPQHRGSPSPAGRLPPDELLRNVVRLCLRHRLLPSRVGQYLRQECRVPSLRPHYQASLLLRTRPSLRPALVLGASRVFRLAISLGYRGDRFPRSAQEPLAGLTPSSCRSPLGQSTGFLRASSQANNWSLVSATFQRFRHVLNGSLAFVLPAHT